MRVGMGRMSRRGFTLIEMLVVIGITVILLGLVFGPVITSFNLTHQAQVMTDSQDQARQTLEQIQRELSQAMFVYDNSNSDMRVYLNPQEQATFTRNSNDPAQSKLVRYAKIDFVLPKLMMHCNSPDHPANQPRDYERGDLAWPDCPFASQENTRDVEARPVEPLKQDSTIVRYFIGLRDNDPQFPYANIYTMKDLPDSAKDNPYVLYRVEFKLNDDNLFPSTVTDRLNWPDFFYSADPCANGQPAWQNWRKIAKVVGRDTDIDMMAVQTTGSGSNVVQTPVPAVKFMPTGIDNDVLAPTFLSDKSAEAPSAVPTKFRATQGHWGNNFQVRVYASDYSSFYYTGFNSSTGDLWVFDNSNNPVFNISDYQKTGQFSLGSGRGPGLMFNVDPNKGEVDFTFQSPLCQFRTSDIEGAFRTQYAASLANDGIGVGERTVQQVGGPVDPTSGIPNAKIIPGTEVVFGPNLTPGPGYGARVRYERVPLALGDPGLNQYKIDYDTGQMWFSSDPNISLVNTAAASMYDSIDVTYSFHNNDSGQIVKADYDTKNLISVALAMRLFDATSGKPMVVELNDQVKVRNIAR